MEFFYAFLFVISFLLGIAEKSKGLQCFYCGIKDLCELPFDEETVEKIECPNSCLKFEGFSKDGQKVTVRDCGFFDADECTENHVYEGTTAVGNLCHCRSDQCNNAAVGTMSVVTFTVMTIINLLLR